MSDPNNQNQNNQNQNNQNGQNGQQAPAFDYEKLANLISGKQTAAEDTVLKSYFREQGLSADEMKQAIGAFKEQKAKNTPDPAALSAQLSAAQNELAAERLGRAAEKAARKLGADEKSIDYVVTLADFSEVVTDGKISDEKLTAAVKKVLDDVPAFKKSADGRSGVNRVGGDGDPGDGQGESEDALRKLFGLKPKK